MNGSGCMHSKLQLLKYKDHLRIVVPSANLVSFDWGETGDMENVSLLLPVILEPRQLLKPPCRSFSSLTFLSLMIQT